MTTPEPIVAHICDLVTRILEGCDEVGDRDALDQMLVHSADARRAYVTIMDDTSFLRRQAAERQPQLVRDLMAMEAEEGEERLPWRIMGFVAAATLAVAALAAWWITPMPGPPMPAVKPLGVATLIRATGVAWPAGATAWPELSRLAQGDVLRFDAGEVELVFDTGVEVIVRGPADFEIRAGDHAFSRLGKISARVGADGEGFTIETPVAKVIDLGTEFAIEVTPSGLTDVAVLRGRVDLAVNGADDSGREVSARRLGQGEGMRVEPGGKTSRVMAISSDQFPDGSRSSRRPRNSQPIIARISDNSPSESVSKFYHIIRGGLAEDAPAFVDRNHEWNGVDSAGIPACLDGVEYVMTFNDDKFFEGFQMAVEVSRPASLYVLMSDRVPVPEWLRGGFIDTGLKIGLDEAPNRFKPRVDSGVGPGQSVDTTFSVWRRDVLEPGTVVLGGVMPSPDREGFNMYGVAVAALPPAETGSVQIVPGTP
jgi:hypothetical protein